MREGKILLVEDNEDDVVLTIRALKMRNIQNEVIVAKDGVEALDMLFGTNGRPPLLPVIILMDLKLPKLGGLDTLKKIRKNETTKTIPIVILTTSDEEEDVMKSYRLGANSYIRKPVDFNSFLNVVGQLGLYWLMINEPLPRQEKYNVSWV